MSIIDVVWSLVLIFSYVYIVASIVLGRGWEAAKQRRLAKAMASYLMGLLVVSIYWTVIASTVYVEYLTLMTTLVLVGVLALIALTWILMIKLWG
ncbi:MAG: hypothetical protein DRN15_00355 [Thermoprotei archaeon]|nr:MAG: hypothetical protein DRN15_00355 [Thermoprotei archaeon]